MKNRLPIFLALVWVCGALTCALAQSPYNIYFGDFHSQTWYSDGNKEQDTNTYKKPVAKAITYARDNANDMDFLGVSDHNHHESSDLHMNLGYWRAGNAEADSMNQDGVFVGMYGQEWGTIGGGGHVLVYGTNKLFGWEAGNYDVYVQKSNYSMLFDSVKKYGGFCYFAHPQSTDYSGIFSNALNAAWDSVVVGTAMKNGPALDASYTETDPSSTDYTSRYHDLLRQGYHVAPCANQDNHYTNFGHLNQQRTAVLATSLTRANVVEALRHRRAYATEDHNLQLRFEVGAHQMGEKFTMSGSVPLRVKVVEPDGDAMSTIELRYGVPGSGSVPTALASVAGQDSLVVSQPQPIGTTYYYYAYVRETNGREAWSAPMWITVTQLSAPAQFSQLSPANSSAGQEISGTLTWQASSGAVQYDVYLATDTAFSTPVSANQAGISYSYSGLTYGASYFWKVVAKNDSGQVTASGAPWSFVTHGPPPGGFMMVSPPNSATSLLLSGMLNWNSSPNAASYDVYLDQVNPPSVRADSNLADTSAAYDGLLPGTTYYWKVVAKNPNGSVAASNAVSSFTTANVPLPPSNAAVDNVTTNSILFHWTDVATDESGYRIYRSLAPGGPFAQIGTDLPQNSVSFTDTGLQVDQRCYYRIVPFNGQGEGGFIGLNRSTLAAPPGQPLLSNASYRSVNITLDPGPNPSTTQFSIAGGCDSTQLFVQQDGTLGPLPVWRTMAGWGGGSGLLANRLHQCLQYTFAVTGRNGDSVLTSPGAEASQTLACFSTARTVGGGWEIVSLPVGETGSALASSFPNARSKAFSYQGGYVGNENLVRNAGYWIKFDSSAMYEFAGDPDIEDSIPVVGGWNLIGSTSVAVDVAAIQSEPAGILNSPFFGYDGAYAIADSLRPVNGYWVKAKGSGKLVLSSLSGSAPLAAKQAANLPEPPNIFVFEDQLGHRQALSIGEADARSESGYTHEVPPVPPPEAFDVRFQSQRSAETLRDRGIPTQRFPVALQTGGHSVKLSWRIEEKQDRRFRLLSDAKNIVLPASGSTQLSSGTRRIVIEVQNSQSQPLPSEFALHQNYPNPFNPSTSIRYDLPVESRVSLTVYNLLGIMVAKLVDEVQPAGYHVVLWEPAEASGIYLYRVEATGTENSSQSFRGVKRMVIVR